MVNACNIMYNTLIENEGRVIRLYDPDDVVIQIEVFVSGTTEFLA